MRKPLLTRILGLIVLYCAVFIILASLQFSKKGSFSHSIGAMSITGQYQLSAEELNPDALSTSPGTVEPSVRGSLGDVSRAHYLAGGARIFFGGLEFNLKEDNDRGLFIAGEDGVPQPVNPYLLVLTENSAQFGLPGGTTLVFNYLDLSGSQELRISAEFAEDISLLNIPFRPRRSSLVRSDGQIGLTYNGVLYQFSRSSEARENGNLILSAENAVASYHARPNQRVFNPADYVIAQARNSNSFDDAIGRWREQSFNYWEKNISAGIDENIAIAYLGEALRRGTYRAALTSVSREYPVTARRSYESSVFLGNMTNAFRAFNEAEREKTERITRQINGKSIGFLTEDHVLDYLQVRGLTALTNSALEVLLGSNSMAITLDLCPGLLEAYRDFRRWRLSGLNPVEQFIEQICFLVSENIHFDAEKNLAFVVNTGSGDTEFNLRLGMALLDWATSADNENWAALGRSLILSSLIQGDHSGSARLYRLLNPGNYYPRTALLSTGGHWIWSASPTVSATVREDETLNISVSFPAGETHYVMIRGVRPFNRLQLYDTNWRSDPQFERYDSSGWIYYPQDQTLIVKMRHRTTVEYIRIFYRAAPEPETGAASGTETEDSSVDS